MGRYGITPRPQDYAPQSEMAETDPTFVAYVHIRIVFKTAVFYQQESCDQLLIDNKVTTIARAEMNELVDVYLNTIYPTFFLESKYSTLLLF